MSFSLSEVPKWCISPLIGLSSSCQKLCQSQIVNIFIACPLLVKNVARGAAWLFFLRLPVIPLLLSLKMWTRWTCLFYYPRSEPKAITELLCALSEYPQILEFPVTQHLLSVWIMQIQSTRILKIVIQSKCNTLPSMFGLFRPHIHNHHHHVSASVGLLGAHVKYRNQQSLCCCKVSFLLHHVSSSQPSKEVMRMAMLPDLLYQSYNLLLCTPQ